MLYLSFVITGDLFSFKGVICWKKKIHVRHKISMENGLAPSYQNFLDAHIQRHKTYAHINLYPFKFFVSISFY